MNQRYILFRRGGVFYYEDTETGKQLSLRTKDEAEAQTLLHAKNESVRQPALNLQIARAYLSGFRSPGRRPHLAGPHGRDDADQIRFDAHPP